MRNVVVLTMQKANKGIVKRHLECITDGRKKRRVPNGEGEVSAKVLNIHNEAKGDGRYVV